MKITNINWDCQITFTREEIKHLGKLAEFIGNIEKDYKQAFPSALRDTDWHHIREAFRKFSKMESAEVEFHNAVYKASSKL